MGQHRLDAVERLQPAEAGHVLVQEDDVVFLRLRLLHGVEAVVHGIHRVAFALQEEHMGTEQIDLVVGPEDGSGHQWYGGAFRRYRFGGERSHTKGNAE